MADNTSVKSVLSVIATKKSRVPDLPIKNGQLIFVTDAGRVALDYGGTRTFYNQIHELDSEAERKDLENPTNGYYFVIERAVLWAYQDGWTQLTGNPENIVFIDDVEVSGLGKPRTLYVSKEKKQISVFDETTEEFVVVADSKGSITSQQIQSLFA